MEKSFIILYEWKEPRGKLQKVLLKEDEDSENYFPINMILLKIDKEGEIVFDVDRLDLENQNCVFGRISEDLKFLYMERLSYVI